MVILRAKLKSSTSAPTHARTIAYFWKWKPSYKISNHANRHQCSPKRRIDVEKEVPMSPKCPQCGTRWGRTSGTLVDGEAARLFTCPKCRYSTTQRTRVSKKRIYVIRVVISGDDTFPLASIKDNASMLDCLRFMKIITVHRSNAEGLCFDIRCPFKPSASKAWSETGAERMKSHGFNAVSAPST